MREKFLTELIQCQNSIDWNNKCDEVKNHYGDYPEWWFNDVIISGLLNEIVRGWVTC